MAEDENPTLECAHFAQFEFSEVWCAEQIDKPNLRSSNNKPYKIIPFSNTFTSVLDRQSHCSFGVVNGY